MLKIGLTGGIGSGKTTVSDQFAALGIPVIDTDVIARDLTSHKDILTEISDAFGDAVLMNDGELDRHKLAMKVFKDDVAKIRLENILHPRIRESIKQQLRELTSQKTPPAYTVIVIPLLFETGFSDLVDRILTVISDEDTRILRVRERDGRSINEIRSIIQAQVSDTIRLSGSDDVIRNDTEKADLNTQVKKLHDSYLALSAQPQ